MVRPCSIIHRKIKQVGICGIHKRKCSEKKVECGEYLNEKLWVVESDMAEVENKIQGYS
jgi:hypothetical protein